VPLIDPIIIFVVTGMVSMSGALCAGAINKLSDEDKPEFASTREGMTKIVLAGNLAAVAFIFAAAYGFSHLDWWIPLICMFITFPVFHFIVVQQMLGNIKGLVIMSVLSLASLPVLYLYW